MNTKVVETINSYSSDARQGVEAKKILNREGESFVKSLKAGSVVLFSTKGNEMCTYIFITSVANDTMFGNILKVGSVEGVQSQSVLEFQTNTSCSIADFLQYETVQTFDGEYSGFADSLMSMMDVSDYFEHIFKSRFKDLYVIEVKKQ
jgi:hypothetical protein